MFTCIVIHMRVEEIIERMSMGERRELEELIGEIFECQWKPCDDSVIARLAESLRSFGFAVDDDWRSVYCCASVIHRILHHL